MARIDFVTGAPEKYAHLVDRLATVAERTAAVLAGQTSAELRREPPDGWSAQRVLGHMAFHAHANGVFTHQLATMTDPQRTPFPSGYEDPELATRDPLELLQFIEDETAQTVALLSGTPDAAWGRPGFVRGARRSLRQHVQAQITHLEEHIAQLAQVLSR